MSYIEFRDVKKIYKTGTVNVTALDGCSFTVEKGELCVIVGQSGAGKTTLLNILGGMDRLTSGEVFLDGKEIKSGDAIDVRFPRTLIVQKSDGLEYSVTLDIQTLRTGLPSVALTVDEFAEIDSKDYYFSSILFTSFNDMFNSKHIGSKCCNNNST